MADEPNNVYAFPSARIDPAWSITKKELCDRLGVSPRWVEYRMREGLPYRKDRFSRLVKFPVRDVDQWLSDYRKAG